MRGRPSLPMITAEKHRMTGSYSTQLSEKCLRVAQACHSSMTPFTPCNISYFHTGLELSSLPFLLLLGLLFEHTVGRKTLSDLEVGCGCAVLQGVWVVSYTCYPCNTEIHTCRYLQWSHQQHKLNDTFDIKRFSNIQYNTVTCLSVYISVFPLC